MRRTFYDWAKRYPPVLVRMMARKNGKAMTDRDVSDATGIVGVWSCYTMTTWEFIPLGHMRSMTRACGIDFTSRKDMNRIEAYWRPRQGRQAMLHHLTSHSEWKTVFLPMIVAWRKSMVEIPPELPEPIKRVLKGIKV